MRFFQTSKITLLRKHYVDNTPRKNLIPIHDPQSGVVSDNFAKRMSMSPVPEMTTTTLVRGRGGCDNRRRPLMLGTSNR
jgi:hypothetical protein